MTEHAQPLFSPTIAFTIDEAQHLHAALESCKKVMSVALFERGIKPTDDEVYKTYDVLAERCLAFWMMHSNPPKEL